MAVNFAEKSAGNVIEVIICGKLQQRDYAHIVPKIELSIERFGKIRILVQLVDFHGWTACALWKDMKFDVWQFRDVERLAMVGDKAWEKGMAVFCKPFTTAKTRYFDSRKLDNARRWIERDLGSASARTLRREAASSYSSL